MKCLNHRTGAEPERMEKAGKRRCMTESISKRLGRGSSYGRKKVLPQVVLAFKNPLSAGYYYMKSQRGKCKIGAHRSAHGLLRKYAGGAGTRPKVNHLPSGGPLSIGSGKMRSLEISKERSYSSSGRPRNARMAQVKDRCSRPPRMQRPMLFWSEHRARRDAVHAPRTSKACAPADPKAKTAPISKGKALMIPEAYMPRAPRASELRRVAGNADQRTGIDKPKAGKPGPRRIMVQKDIGLKRKGPQRTPSAGCRMARRTRDERPAAAKRERTAKAMARDAPPAAKRLRSGDGRVRTASPRTPPETHGHTCKPPAVKAPAVPVERIPRRSTPIRHILARARKKEVMLKTAYADASPDS